MTRAQIVALIAGGIALVLILDLVRRRQLREKYAALWLVTGTGMAVLAVRPVLLDRIAGWLGVADPPNLLFFLAILVLLTVVVQLSFEVSRLEERTRTLAEEVALLRSDGDAPRPAPPPVED